MAAKKAQMFVVTAVFLTSMLFVVQQMFITYSMIDSSVPFKTKQIYVMKGIIDSVNETIEFGEDTRADCQRFEKNLQELLSLLKDDVSSEGFLLVTGYNLDCGTGASTPWTNTYPNKAPLSLSIRLSETYDISGNVIKFYHKQ
ncbi:unnamed protein product [marine sediment metagenome]|uniref:Uncharacterized protein n=1 Tax=marine sediment metagenome TaxID=412755 RepID=X1CNC8_9ZZZZ